MAYCMFLRRSLYLTNKIFTLQSQIENIMEQKQSLLEFSANISDGVLTPEELANDPKNFNNYAEFYQSYQAFTETADSEGGAATTIGAIMTQAADQYPNDQSMMAINELLKSSVSQEYAKQYSKRIDALENELDIKQKKLETKLAAAEKELESVEQAEAKAIDRATPKYDGLA